MKVRNIVFSGFAAAILMGTANAAPFRIASQQYVDNQVAALSATGGAISDVAADVDTLEETVGDVATGLNNGNDTNFGENTDTVLEALNDLDDAINTKQDQLVTSGANANLVGTGTVTISESNGVITVNGAAPADASASTAGVAKLYSETGSNTDGSMTQASITNALADKANASDLTTLSNKVGSGTLTSTIGNTAVSDVVSAINALETKTTGIAGSAEVASIQETLTGDPEDPNDGGLVADVAENTSDITALEGKVGDGQLTGFGAGVTDLTEAVNDLKANKQDALSADELGAIAKLVDGYASCIQQAEALREAGDNSAAHCVLSASTAGGVEWTPVTFPWAE